MDSTNPNNHTANRIKHLELIQSVILRLASNSAVMKRYCVVMVAAGMALYRVLNEPTIIIAVGAMVIVFWLLDAKYLQQEHWFRNLYDSVRHEAPEKIPDFRLNPDKEIRESVAFWGRAFSWSAAGLYIPLVTLVVIFWFVL